MPISMQPQLSIAVGTDPPTQPEEEVAYVYDATKARKHNQLTVVIQHNSIFGVYTGKYRLPTIWKFCIWFGPMLLLSSTAWMPMWVTISIPNEQILSYPVARCRIVNFIENIDIHDEVTEFFANVTYTLEDNGVHYGEIVYKSSVDHTINIYFVQFYENVAQLNQTFPCFYHGSFIIATENPRFVIDYSNGIGRSLTGGLTSIWLFVALMVLIRLAFSNRTEPRPIIRTVPKKVYEETGRAFLEVNDWGEVDVQLRQAIHAMLYTFCVMEYDEYYFNGAPNKKIRLKFTQYNLVPMDLCDNYFFPIVAVLSTAVVVVMIRFAFMQHYVYDASVLWCLATTFVCVPVLCFCKLACTLTEKKFSATAEATRLNSPVVDVRIQQGVYSPLEMLGELLTGCVTRSIV